MKRSRSWRRHQKNRIARARRKFDQRGMSDNELATRHPHDCGSRCLLCHRPKLLESSKRRQALKRALAHDL